MPAILHDRTCWYGLNHSWLIHECQLVAYTLCKAPRSSFKIIKGTLILWQGEVTLWPINLIINFFFLVVKVRKKLLWSQYKTTKKQFRDSKVGIIKFIKMQHWISISRVSPENHSRMMIKLWNYPNSITMLGEQLFHAIITMIFQTSIRTCTLVWTQSSLY